MKAWEIWSYQPAGWPEPHPAVIVSGPARVQVSVLTIDTKPPPASGECATGLPKVVRSQTTAFDNAL
jgi:hypothetical protein